MHNLSNTFTLNPSYSSSLQFNVSTSALALLWLVQTSSQHCFRQSKVGDQLCWAAVGFKVWFDGLIGGSVDVESYNVVHWSGVT